MSSDKSTINQLAHENAMNIGHLTKQININNPLPTAIPPPKNYPQAQSSNTATNINPYKQFATLANQYPIVPLIRETFLYLMRYYPKSAHLILSRMHHYIFVDCQGTCKDLFKDIMYKLMHATWFSSFDMFEIAEIIEDKMANINDYGNYQLCDVYDALVEEWNHYMVQELVADTNRQWIVEVGENDECLFWMMIHTTNGPLWWPGIINVLYEKGAFCKLLNNGINVFIDYDKIRPFKMNSMFKDESVNVIQLHSKPGKLSEQWVDAVFEASKMMNVESKIETFFGFKYNVNLQKQKHEQKQAIKRKSEYSLVQKDLKKARHDMHDTKLSTIDDGCKKNEYQFVDDKRNKFDLSSESGNTKDATGNTKDGVFRFDSSNKQQQHTTMNTNNNNKKCVSDWTVCDVLGWFSFIGYGKYVDKLTPKFKEDEIDGRSLQLMDMNDLKNYGINNFYDRKIILKNIENL